MTTIPDWPISGDFPAADDAIKNQSVNRHWHHDSNDHHEHKRMKAGRVLIVEDDEGLRRVAQSLVSNLGYETEVAVDVPQALEILQKQPHNLVISDLNLPGPSGLELLKRVRIDYPETVVIMVTAYGTLQTAVEAMKAGAYDYLTKPVHPYELRAIVNRVFERQNLVEEVRTLRSTVDRKFGFENIIGHSGALLHILDSASSVAHSSTTVLINGETGTGKELLAKAIHFNSDRRQRPFVVINCGAIPRDLLESELFGHVRGAFTGALTHKKGKVEMADGGTVFLDEIGEMPLEAQVRVLRLIQEREIEKVGASKPITVDVRIISATHRNLELLVKKGEFREDLYYRLAVVPIQVPPLRERFEDIPEFVQHFFQLSKMKCGRPDLKMPQHLNSYFSQYDWPGNIRQLQNAIERMVVLCRTDEITVADLPEFLLPRASSQSAWPPPAERLTLDAAEKQLILQTLQRCNWNFTRAAMELDVSRKMLISRIAKHGIGKDAARKTTTQTA
jgi:DNA-binding NtrC family response regulator